jgi:hypothetical protein
VQRVFEALFLTRVPRLERPRPDRFGRWPDTYVADAREKGWGTDLPRFHLKENILRVDEKLAAQIADAPAPSGRMCAMRWPSGIRGPFSPFRRGSWGRLVRRPKVDPSKSPVHDGGRLLGTSGE